MKLNLFAMPTIPATMEERRRERPIGRSTDRYQQMLDQIRTLAVLADDLGVDAFSVTEHHFHTEGGEMMPNPTVLFADLAARTERIELVPFSIVIPTHNPLRVAEDIALLDQLSKGRAGVAFARGYQKRWIQIITQGGAVSNTDPAADARNREIFTENIEIVLKAWDNDVFDYEGKHFQVPFPYREGVTGWPATEWTRAYGADGEIDDDGAIRKIGTVPRTYHSDRPDIYLPLTMSPATTQFAAAKGFKGIIFASQPAAFTQVCESYRAAAAEHGRDLALGENLGAVRGISVADSADEAFDIAAKSVGHSYHEYFGEFGFNEMFRTDADDPDSPVKFKDEADCLQRLIDIGWMLCGTPDQVKEQIDQLRTIHGAGGDLEWLQWGFYQQGPIPLDVQTRQIEMFMTKVWPSFA